MFSPLSAFDSYTAMSFWDQQFSVPGFKYGTSPNAFLQQQAVLLVPRSIVLVPGDGEGRNGVWLAEQGHTVTSIDSSPVGLEKSRALAAARGVSLQTVEADLAHWSPPSASFDAVVIVYLHLPPAVRRLIHHVLWSSLRDGGVVILEAFHPRQIAYRSGGPKDVTMLYTLDLLRADLATVPNMVFDEVMAEETETTLDEGPGHQGPAFVTRLVVRGHSS